MEGLEGLRPVFREEAAELLTELEAVVLELERRPGTPELVDRTFRVLHTIKGASTMYGYDDVAALAHELESVFDVARAEGLRVPEAAISLTLRAKDCIRDLVFADADSEDAVAARVIGIALASTCREMRFDEPGGVANAQSGDALARYEITLAPSRDALRRGLNLFGIVRELAMLGRLEVVADETVPLLNELDTEEVYVSWQLTLLTVAQPDVVESAFMFLDPSEYRVERIAAEEVPATFSSVDSGHLDVGNDSVRVAAGKLDRLVNLVGELVTAHAAMGGLAAELADPTLATLSEEVGRLTSEMRESVLDIRMVPVGSVFGRFRRHARDLARELGKQVEIVTEGGETELDKTVIDRIEKPLLHILRNSLDHGIESPEVREAAGKPSTGTIRISASQAGGNVYLHISDDGRGMDRAAIRSKAVSAGIIGAEDELTDDEIHALVFRPGFSTADAVTNLSGRGVGLDVVSRAVQELQGSASIAPLQSGGTCVTLRLPLTLAIVEALLVSVGEERFMVPLALVEECVEVDQAEAWRAHGRAMVDVHGEIVPFLRLREFFSINGEPDPHELCVIVSLGGRRFGLVVDSIEDQLQVVMKNLGREFGRTEGLSGASILGNGTIALVLDAGELLRLIESECEVRVLA